MLTRVRAQGLAEVEQQLAFDTAALVKEETASRALKQFLRDLGARAVTAGATERARLEAAYQRFAREYLSSLLGAVTHHQRLVDFLRERVRFCEVRAAPPAPPARPR